MIYKEQRFNILSMSGDYYIVHFIPANFNLKTYTAQQLNAKADLLNKLNEKYPNYLTFFKEGKLLADCLETKNIFSLITTADADEETTCSMVTLAFEKLRKICLDKHIKKLAISMEGVHFNGNELNFSTVIDNKEKVVSLKLKMANLIQYTFGNTNIEIVNCI